MLAKVASEMTVTYRLEEADDGTELIGIHENVPTGVSPEDTSSVGAISIGRLADLVEHPGDDEARAFTLRRLIQRRRCESWLSRVVFGHTCAADGQCAAVAHLRNDDSEDLVVASYVVVAPFLGLVEPACPVVPGERPTALLPGSRAQPAPQSRRAAKLGRALDPPPQGRG
jgi:hypothetical protein